MHIAWPNNCQSETEVKGVCFLWVGVERVRGEGVEIDEQGNLGKNIYVNSYAQHSSLVEWTAEFTACCKL